MFGDSLMLTLSCKANPGPSSPDGNTSDRSESEPDDLSAVNRSATSSGAKTMREIGSEGKGQRRAFNPERREADHSPKHKKVKLNKLSSISAGGASKSLNQGVRCLICGKAGHVAKSCPARPKRGR